MPKVVVYVRAEDARVIAAKQNVEIADWVRMVVADEIADFHARRARTLGDHAMPAVWARRKEELEEGA